MESNSDVKIPAFDRAIRLIEERYHANPTGMGWRFAYGPKGALTSGFPVWLIGIMPGGREPDKAEPSREDGNDYRLEGWSDDNTPNKLQHNVFRLFQLLGERLKEPWEQLLDRCFTANICPFRAPTEDDLDLLIQNWPSFCRHLWKPLLAEHAPRVMICLGRTSFEIMSETYSIAGFDRVGGSTYPTGWGSISWSSDDYRHEAQTLTIVRIPHLSRFGIFTSEKCQPQSNVIPSLIASIITEHDTKNT